MINLSICRFTRFNRYHKTEDLLESMKLLEKAMVSLPGNHPVRTWLKDQSYLAQYELDPLDQKINMAFSSFQASADHPTSSVSVRLKVAQD